MKSRKLWELYKDEVKYCVEAVFIISVTTSIFGTILISAGQHAVFGAFACMTFGLALVVLCEAIGCMYNKDYITATRHICALFVVGWLFSGIIKIAQEALLQGVPVVVSSTIFGQTGPIATAIIVFLVSACATSVLLASVLFAKICRP